MKIPVSLLVIVMLILTGSFLFLIVPPKESTPVSNTQIQNQVRNPDVFSSKVITASDTEWSSATRLIKGRCMSYFEADPSLPGFIAQVTPKVRPSEFDWHLLSERPQGEPQAWVRYRSKGPGPTKINEEIKRKGTCN